MSLFKRRTPTICVRCRHYRAMTSFRGKTLYDTCFATVAPCLDYVTGESPDSRPASCLFRNGRGRCAYYEEAQP